MGEKLTPKKLQEMVRNDYFAKVVEALTAADCEVLRTATNEIAIPCLDAENNEQWVCIKVSVPTGSRDGEAYDGYGVAEAYNMHITEKAEKAKAAAEAKAKKMARDAKMRAEKKAQREAKAQK